MSIQTRRFGWYAIVFLLGFTVMSYELFVTRMAAPTIGLSVYTWTAAIGWILFGISAGAGIGGYLTDKYPTRRTMHIAIGFAASALSIVIGFIAARNGLALTSDHMILSVLLLTFIIAFPFACCVGAITPHVASLVITDIHHAGGRYSHISFSNALGSIMGVFLTGFFFFGAIPLSISIATLGITMALFAFIIAWNVSKNMRILFAIGGMMYIGIWMSLLGEHNCITNATGIYCADTPYYTARVVDTSFDKTPARVLFLDADAHSVKSDSLLPTYRAFSYIPKVLLPNASSIAVLGAGAYVAPQELSAVFPDAAIEVIDIDPKLEKITTEYFFPEISPTISTTTTDARWHIAHTEKKYDVIIADIYDSLIEVPFHVSTYEYMRQVRARLNPNGLYIFAFVNTQSAETNTLGTALYQTANKVFPSVSVLGIGESTNETQNIILVASNGEIPPYAELVSLLSKNTNTDDLAAHVIENPDSVFMCNKDCIITDDFAPTERLMAPVQKKYFKSLVSYLHFAFEQ